MYEIFIKQIAVDGTGAVVAAPDHGVIKFYQKYIIH
jgi:hypothetical protein